MQSNSTVIHTPSSSLQRIFELKFVRRRQDLFSQIVSSLHMRIWCTYLYCHQQNTHWVVLKYHVMTCATIAAQSHFNAYYEVKIGRRQNWFIQSVVNLHRRSQCPITFAIHSMFIKLYSSIMEWPEQQLLQCGVISILIMNSNMSSDHSDSVQMSHACLGAAKSKCTS